MGHAQTQGAVAIIEAPGSDPRHFTQAAIARLGAASVVIADPQTHPNVLWYAAPSASVELRAWDSQAAARAGEQAAAGAQVVCVVSGSSSAPALQTLRASGVPIEAVPGVPAASDPSGGPLSGRRILVTRPRPAAQAQRQRFTALGADAVALPCLRICPPSDPDPLDAALRSIRSFDGVILSSRPGVDALFEGLLRVGLDARALAGLSVVAVGQATATACLKHAISPDIVPSQPHSEGIVEALTARDRLAGRWLHVRAEDGRATLDRAISSAGGAYTLAPAYRTDRPPAPPGVAAWLQGAALDVICLHSGRTGEHLRRTLDELLPSDHALARTSVVSGGPITTEALQEQGFEVAATASSPGDEGMVDAVLGLLAAD